MKNKKMLVLVAAIALLLCVAVGGTLAWLTADSGDPLVNTFTPTSMTVDVAETTGANYPMVPGTSIAKNPKVTYTTDVPAYVFVEVTESIGEDLTFSNYIGYDVITGAGNWTKLTGVDGVDNVYYMEVAAGNNPEGGISVIQDKSTPPVADKVTVNADLELEDMTKLDDKSKYPKLTFNAYIIQKDPFTSAAAAWENVK